MIKLLVGLGNPGAEYAATRHNAGFWWIDKVAQTMQLALSMEKAHQGLLARTSVAGQPLWLLEPQTFMNASGRSVGSVARFFKIEPAQILVIHDELDLPPGEAKLKFGGGHAGHNGLRDIHAQLGTADYWRLRMGIGHPGVKSEVIHWVLKKPSLDHRIAIDQCIDRSLAAVPHFLAGSMDKAMQVIHTTTPPRPKLPRPTQSPANEADRQTPPANKVSA
jgi:PTH1 family peptidyl-tRNA hydrolase